MPSTRPSLEPSATPSSPPSITMQPSKTPTVPILTTGNVVLNEVMMDPGSTVGGVWIELLNREVSHAVNLQGWQLRVRNVDTDGQLQVQEYVITKRLILPANGWVVLGARAGTDINGGYTPDYVLKGLALTPTGDDMVLLDATVQRVDRVDFRRPEFDSLRQPGASMFLYNAVFDNTYGYNWRTSSARTFGTTTAGQLLLLGTPGAPNEVFVPLDAVLHDRTSWTLRLGVQGIRVVVANPAGRFQATDENGLVLNANNDDNGTQSFTVQFNQDVWILAYQVTDLGGNNGDVTLTIGLASDLPVPIPSGQVNLPNPLLVVAETEVAISVSGKPSDVFAGGIIGLQRLIVQRRITREQHN